MHNTRSIIRQTRTLAATALATLLLLPGTGWAASTLDEVRESGVVRIGFANESPFGYATPQGELTGEAPEVAKVVLARMGIDNVEAVLMPFRSLVPALQARRFDMIAAGMFVTPARCEQVLFSEPTFSVGQAMIVKSDNPQDIHGYSDFVENSSLKLGVVGGGQAHKYAREIGISDDQISVFADGPSGRAAVEAGRINAWAMTSLAIQRLLDSAGDAKVERAEPFEASSTDTRGHGAFAFHRDDGEFRDAFNTALKEFIGTPEHRELVRPFGFTEEEAPMMTTEQLCADAP
ncbi:ectoine/hydroxyectoine ABC transporter substrate-binding protein EhuB [Halomonas huangheensis]|uniref:Solute-binding protein family 3/N-terminal domain-containing protein n=1 Tax=Halomonas huangheensis TaxID=1178482 RepID=W1N6A0_9GAMM|nr:ectoine/hydroxyectoine ABC transporter substrate-binding protein EhuB [Halomonas huangheensis]ALM50891.1 hypothetical protein AR456_00205 [Halomonas huangheensis]ERL51034.1 hypothetical protein BJB45_20800 [Halomonas huangheensis]